MRVIFGMAPPGGGATSYQYLSSEFESSGRLVVSYVGQSIEIDMSTSYRGTTTGTRSYTIPLADITGYAAFRTHAINNASGNGILDFQI